MHDETKPLIEQIPTEWELAVREAAALRELEMVRRLRRAVQRAELFRAADARRRREEQEAMESPRRKKMAPRCMA